MTFNYAGLRDGTVQPLLKEFGKAVDDTFLLVPGVSTGPNWDPELSEPVPHPVTVVETRTTLKDTEGTLVQMTDRAFLLSPEGLTVDPSLKYILQVGGVKLQVIEIRPLKPGPVTMLWKVFARK